MTIHTRTDCNGFMKRIFAGPWGLRRAWGPGEHMGGGFVHPGHPGLEDKDDRHHVQEPVGFVARYHCEAHQHTEEVRHISQALAEAEPETRPCPYASPKGAA